MIKPPYGRQGNKFYILEDLMPYIPEHKIYIEPFFGSGALFWNLPKCEKSIINDKSKDIYNLLKLLQKAPPGVLRFPHFTRLEDMQEFYFKKPISLPDKIIYLKIKLSLGFNGMPVKNDKIYKFANWEDFRSNSNIYTQKLKNVIILNEDYQKVIKNYDHHDAFIFLDPPYENSDKDFYEDTIINYENLCDLLKSIKGKFLLTINDSPLIRKIFKDFIIIKKNIKSQGWRTDNRHQVRKELFIMNYYF
jgi:DNA adenine methylase